MLRDLRHAARSLRHTPGFAALAVVTLSLGLAATALMATAVNAAFLKPLPYPNESALLKVYQASRTSSQIAVPLPVVRGWIDGQHSFEGVAAFLSGSSVNASDDSMAIRARAARVTSQFFQTMRVTPERGRLFSAEDLAVGAQPVVVISDGLWRRLTNGRDDILTRPIRIEGTPVPVVGVLPQGFGYPDDTEIWTSIEREGPDAYGSSTAHNFDVVARLRAGATLDSATSDLTALSLGMEARDPDMAKEHMDVAVLPLRTDLLGTQSTVVLIGLGAVLCVLLIACVDVANLMLARSVTMETQIAVKLALGASRTTIIRGVIAEGLLLSIASAVLGTMLSLAGTQLLTAMMPASIAGGEPLAMDWRVVLLIALATSVTGVVCGLLPAWRSTKVDVRQAMATGSRSIATSPHRSMRALVGVEVAVAFVLIFGAGLLVRTYASLEHVEPGFRTSGVVIATASLGSLPGSPYDSVEVRRDFFAKLDDAVSHENGVTHTGLSAILPLGFSPNGQFEILGQPKKLNGMHYRLVGGEFFETLGIPLVRGRLLMRTDDDRHPRVAVINQSLARTVFASTDPIGQQIRMPGMDGGDDALSTIVGVVADVHHYGPSRPAVPETYFSYLQRPKRTWSMSLLVSGTRPEGDLVAAIRRDVAAIDPMVPPVFSTMADRMAKTLEPSRFRASLLGSLALVAFLLAAAGIVAVVSYGVARRTHEIGLRMALGATPGSVTGMVVRSGFTPVAVGAAVGGFAALFLSRWLATFLFDVGQRDFTTLTETAIALAVAGLVATWLPARRAARIDPMTALRD